MHHRVPFRRITVALLFAVGATTGVSAQAFCPTDPNDRTTKIYEIQGTGHYSPCAGSSVLTQGVVTAIAFNGFYMQDAQGDGNTNTSDGIFVFTGGRPSVSVGDVITADGSVSEFIPGGAATGNLSITQLFRPAVTVLSSGNPLPVPSIIGRGGRVPPNEVVISLDETDPPINLQDPADAMANQFNPDVDGIDYYETLEGMRVIVRDTVTISGTRTFSPFSSEIVTLADQGTDVAPSDPRTARGGINLQPDPDNRGDQNPERVQIQFDGTLFPDVVPAVGVGGRLGDVTGVMGYSFGNFEVNATEPLTITPTTITPESSDLQGSKFKLTVASYNVLNLSPDASDDNQRATLAAQIVNNLNSPDIIALQEIQDNSGELDDGVVDSDMTLQALADAVVAVGGPVYAFFDVAPGDGASGGIPGGNIRNAFFYNPERVSLRDFESLTPDVLAAADASNPHAFNGTRNPLLATFKFQGRKLTIVNNHLTSRFGSTPIFGGPQPFVQAGEAEREAQTLALHEYVDTLLDKKPNARVIVLGDLNTFEFTNDLTDILAKGGDVDEEPIFFNLIDTLTDDNLYTFNFEGNSQVLDHVFVTKNLRKRAVLDIVHVNVDFPRVDNTFGSDHEPLLVRFDFKTKPDHDEREVEDNDDER